MLLDSQPSVENPGCDAVDAAEDQIYNKVCVVVAVEVKYPGCVCPGCVLLGCVTEDTVKDQISRV